jgi:hypothetical protein
MVMVWGWRAYSVSLYVCVCVCVGLFQISPTSRQSWLCVQTSTVRVGSLLENSRQCPYVPRPKRAGAVSVNSSSRDVQTDEPSTFPQWHRYLTVQCALTGRNNDQVFIPTSVSSALRCVHVLECNIHDHQTFIANRRYLRLPGFWNALLRSLVEDSAKSRSNAV